MEVLQGMSVDRMVIIFPTALIAMYVIISVQKSLSSRESRYPGLVIPVLCFIVSTVLAIRPLIVADAGADTGLGIYCLRMWLTFNIATVIFLFPYFIQRKSASSNCSKRFKTKNSGSWGIRTPGTVTRTSV